jgi:energy-coupling factor transport system permease protein
MSGAVLTGALERSLSLAAAMDSRGFGRLRPLSVTERRITATTMLIGLLTASVGGYALLDANTSPRVATGLLVLGLALLLIGLLRSNRRAVRTVYRPDPWRTPETFTVLTGVTALVACTAVAWTSPDLMLPGTSPLVWPPLALAPMIGILVAALPAWIAPPVPNPDAKREPQPREPAVTAVQVAA